MKLYADPGASVDAITAALGCSNSQLREWARKRGVARPESARVGGIGPLVALSQTVAQGRAAVDRVASAALSQSYALLPGTDPSQAAALLTAGTNAKAKAQGWAEAQPAGSGAPVVTIVRLLAILVADGRLSDQDADGYAERLDREAQAAITDRAAGGRVEPL